METVKIFRVTTGELIIATVDEFDTTKHVVAKSPMAVVPNQQGLGLAPIVPWAPPPKVPTVTFSPGSIVSVIEDNSEEIIAHYSQLVGRIVLARPPLAFVKN